jgi:4-carboxymuconolactone decarboxylase
VGHATLPTVDPSRMTRTPFLKPGEMNPEQRRIYDEIVASRGTWLNGPYAPMLQQPRIAEPAQKLGEFLRYKTSLAPRLSELAIVVVARHWDCDFEWYQHAAIALRSEVPAEVVESIRLRRQPVGMADDMAVVYDFTRQLLERHKVEDRVYDRAKATLGVVGVVELTALIGYYTLIAFTLNAHEVPLPAGVEPPLRGT